MAAKMQPKSEVRFGKEILLKTERFASRRDLLAVLLKDDQRYSILEVEAAIEKFMNGGA